MPIADDDEIRFGTSPTGTMLVVSPMEFASRTT